MRWIKYASTAVMPVLAMLLFGPSEIHAADDGVLPNTFSAGTPAKASEVNENFGFVNHGNIVLIDGAGAELGTFISTDPIAYLNNNGYIVNLNRLGSYQQNNVTIGSRELSYTTTDCTGTAYYVTNIIMIPGILFFNNGSLYYVPKNAAIVQQIMNSNRDLNGVCHQIQNPDQLQYYVFQVFINDPSVTGESSINKTPPLKIIRRSAN